MLPSQAPGASRHSRSPRMLRIAVVASALVLAMSTAMSAFAAGAAISAPASASLGDTITVTGTGLSSGQAGNLTYNGGTVTTFTASTAGSFAVPFTIPSWAVTGADGRISAKTSSGTLIATTTLTIGSGPAAPTLYVPTQAMPGTQVTVGGAGFSTGQTGTLAINGLAVTSFAATPTGQFSVPFDVPADTTLGVSLISATDPQNRLLSTTTMAVGVTVTGPTISVPAVATPGSTIAVNGLGFTAWQTGMVTYNGQSIGSFNAKADGCMNSTAVVPSSAVVGSTGRVSVKTSTGTLIATTTLTVGTSGPGATPTPIVTAAPTGTPAPTATMAPTAAPTVGPTPTPVATATKTPSPTATPPAGGLPNFDHIYVIIFENKEYSSIVGSSKAPYINSLITKYGLSTNFTAERHPSEPNYIALTSGSTQGITDDGVYNLGVNNLFDQVTASGRSWHAYQQGVPANCFTGSSSSSVTDGVGKPGAYVRKHNPAISYTSISGNKTLCNNSISNLASFNPAGANFQFITPNMINDMHDGTVTDGDNFLKAFLPKITSSAAFNNSLVLVTFDEGTTNTSGGGHIFTLAITPGMTPGYKTAAAYTHYSMLRTIEDAWKLPSLGNASSATAMSFPW